jgi:hypothetical protein
MAPTISLCSSILRASVHTQPCVRCPDQKDKPDSKTDFLYSANASSVPAAVLEKE